MILECVLRRLSCPCLINPQQSSPEIEEFKRVNHMYQVGLNNSQIVLLNFFLLLSSKCSFFFLFPPQVEMQQLISGSRYEGRGDFAVVLQPFLQNYFIPQVGVSCKHVAAQMCPTKCCCYNNLAFSNRWVKLTRASFQWTASTSANELMLRWLLACGITW